MSKPNISREVSESLTRLLNSRHATRLPEAAPVVSVNINLRCEGRNKTYQRIAYTDMCRAHK